MNNNNIYLIYFTACIHNFNSQGNKRTQLESGGRLTYKRRVKMAGINGGGKRRGRMELGTVQIINFDFNVELKFKMGL